MKLHHLLPVIAASGLTLYAAENPATQPAASPAPVDSIGISQGSDQALQSPAADKSGKASVQSGAHIALTGTKFAERAYALNLTEVAAGKLAVDKAKNPAVKAVASQMADDHAKIGAQLKILAAEKEIELPTQGKAGQEKDLAELSALDGASFDNAYIDFAIAEHDEAIILFKEAAASCSDSELKRFALATLPKLETHLQEIKAVKKSL